MRIEKFGGTEARLYQLVAPLVMNPAILRQNNNYPFKTSAHYVWFVALEGERILGFIPIEIREKSAVLNNYYIVGDDNDVLAAMLQEAICDFAQKYKLQSITHIRHLSVFQENGFFVERTWKLYVKMEYRKL